MTDRMIPTVEDAAWWMRRAADVAEYPCVFNDGESCPICADEWQAVENAALALDMALAQASDARRAEADEIRRSVAW